MLIETRLLGYARVLRRAFRCDPAVHFFAVDRHIRRCRESKPYLVAVNFDHRQFDVWANNDPLSSPSTKNQHRASPFNLIGISSVFGHHLAKTRFSGNGACRLIIYFKPIDDKLDTIDLANQCLSDLA